MAFILGSITANEYGINETIDWLEYLRTWLNLETDLFNYDEGCEDDWNIVANRLSDAVFDATQRFGSCGVGNWPAWLMFELARWISNGWGDIEQWYRDIRALAWMIEYNGCDWYTGPVERVAALVVSNVIQTMQEGWIVKLSDEPSAIIIELHKAIISHCYDYADVMDELIEGRHGLRPTIEVPPSPCYAPPPQSPAVRRGSAYTPEWSAPAVFVPPTVNFPNKTQIVTNIKDLLSVVEHGSGCQEKVRGAVAVYEYIWKVPDFVRAYPVFRTTAMLKLIEFDDCGDRWKFDAVVGAPSYTELCDRTLAAISATDVPVPPGYRQVAFGYLRADKTLSNYAPIPQTEKAARNSIAVHLDRLEEHMVSFAPTLAEITRNSRRLRSGALLCAEPIVLPNHVVPNETHEIVVSAEYDGPRTPPTTPPAEVHLFFGGGCPELQYDTQEGADGADAPTDPRPLIVYDDDFLDLEYHTPAAPPPSPPPSPHPEDFEEIECNSDDDDDVFDDCDSEDGWERVAAYHRDAALGLID